MKKIIKILQMNAEPLIIEEQDDSELNEYTKKLSKILSVGHVAILETTESNHIVRPQKIVSISITEEGTRKRKYTKRKVKSKDEPKKDAKQEDIITDG